MFDDNTMPAPNQWVQGVVKLSYGADSSGILCWLEGYNVSTYTDSTGFFYLQLPPSGSMQSLSENGVFLLYFFMGDYKLAAARVVIKDGCVLTNHGGIGRGGNLKRLYTLKKQLNVHITITNDTINNVYDTLHSVIKLSSADGDTVKVITVGNHRELFNGFILEHSGNTKKVIPFMKPGIGLNVFTIIKDTLTLRLDLPIRQGFIEPGKYELFPFMVKHEEYLPNELKRFLKYDFFNFRDTYLNIPYKRERVFFHVQNL
ncbi:hypothetical protein KAR48_10740 [bacterium]|nr:hypothetical protein [bacterium]